LWDALRLILNPLNDSHRENVGSCGLFVPQGSVSLWLFSMPCSSAGTLKGVIRMTLNLLFITVTFNKKQETFEEATHNKTVSKSYEETKTKNQYMSQLF
jgi:hypothetical protein